MGINMLRFKEFNENKYLKVAGTKVSIMHPVTRVAKKVDKTELADYVRKGWLHMGPKKNRVTK